MSRADVIKRYSDGGPLLVYAISELPEDKVDQPIGPGEWTIRQVIAHLVDSDLNGAERMKRVIAEENPTLMACDESAWATRLDYANAPIADAVEMFATNRRWMTRILNTLSDQDFARRGSHSETGMVSLASLLAKYITHLDHHLLYLYGKRSNLGTALPPRYTAQ